MIKIYANSKCVSTSKNLRGVWSYPEKAALVYIRRDDEKCNIRIEWVNGATCSFDAASYEVMQRKFANSRKFKCASMYFRG